MSMLVYARPHEHYLSVLWCLIIIMFLCRHWKNCPLCIGFIKQVLLKYLYWK